MSTWRQCLDELKNNLSEQEFRIWIMPLKVNDQGNLFTVYAPNQYFLDWIKSKYQQNFIACLKKIKNNTHLIVEFSIFSVNEKSLHSINSKTSQTNTKENRFFCWTSNRFI